MSNPLSVYNQKLVEQLAGDAKSFGLVLIVGSGLNGKAAPQWQTLLKELLMTAVKKSGIEDERVKSFEKELTQWCDSNFETLAKATIIKQLLGPVRYRAEIQNAIYQYIESWKELEGYCSGNDPKDAEADKYELLKKVAELSQLDAVKAIATFNFDTILEKAIQCCKAVEPGRKKTPRSYFGTARSWDGNNSCGETDILPIYHVHGLLPHPNNLLKSPDMNVVMSYDEYFERNANPFSWETSSLIHLLRHYCVLWIGVSFNDWNMLRLLDAARGQRRNLHSYVIQSSESIKPKKADFLKVAMRFRAELFNAFGVQLINAGNKYKNVPTTLDAIRRAIQPIGK